MQTNPVDIFNNCTLERFCQAQAVILILVKETVPFHIIDNTDHVLLIRLRGDECRARANICVGRRMKREWNEIKISFSKHYDILSIFNKYFVN